MVVEYHCVNSCMVEYRCVISHMVEYLFVAGRISLRKQSTASQVLAVKGSAGQTVRVPATRRGLEFKIYRTKLDKIFGLL